MSNFNMNSCQSSSWKTRSSLRGPVAIFWDIENCAVPSDMRSVNVVGNIRMSLRAHPTINKPVKMFSAYGDFSAFSRRLKKGCCRIGVQLVHVPNDVASKKTLVDMFLFALDNRPPSSILLISGDRDFAPALHVLGQRGYTIILVIPSRVGVSSALSNASQFIWDWSSMARGHGFVLQANVNVAWFPVECSMNESSLQGSIAIFWDIESCPVPSDVCPEDVASNIMMSSQSHPTINGPVTMFSAYGDFSVFSRRLRKGCQSIGVKLVGVPNDAAYKKILGDMFSFALENRPPSSILLISGDRDFAPALHVLGQRGYTIILVIPLRVGVSSALSNASRFLWEV
ncbi:meiosis regulator and mRNA stability factor 1-like [Olea europaea subsp. europaea]|uniref:Meiosis regulator and mRNA stability factor 1-like n=1 Tax=Olea europaea subsp. europaea TaxID=158383 RepID=A0A8S0S196_OLEEU|nr:meiosis regulator and mRNA stability factor 1-like [Olea europaea subsp. europaea]